MYKYIKHEQIGAVLRLTLHRPQQMNALNDALMDELGHALLEAENNNESRVILITGGDKVFAAGADISAMVNWNYQTVSEQKFITRNWETLQQVSKPVIAAVAGAAIGGGCELALACDVIIASKNARFSLPEIKLGLLPGAGGTQRLPRAIGKAKAMDMCLSARSLSAEQANEWGLISRIVETDELLSKSLELAQTIATYSLPALIAIKESINRAWESPLQEGILFERRALYARFASQDAQEGLHAFIEKRQPHFLHR